MNLTGQAMLKYSLERNVATITLANAPVNVITISMLRDMAARIDESAKAKIIVIRAEGDVFSAGVDVAEHLRPHAAEMIGSFRGVFEALERFEGIVIAVVDGLALGGGCELVCLCDVVIASDRAEFGQPETGVGVLPPVASVLWPRRMGYPRALDLILSGRRISAAEMAGYGLISRVVPTHGFDRSVEKTISEYRAMSRVVVTHAKRACRIGSGAGVAAEVGKALRQVESLYLHSLMKTHDAEEGLRAFLEKRDPKWTDH